MLCAVCWFHGLVRSQPSTSPLGGGSVDMNSVPQLAAKPWETLLDRCAAARPLVKGPSAGILLRVLWVCDRGRGVVDTWGGVGWEPLWWWCSGWMQWRGRAINHGKGRGRANNQGKAIN